MRVVVLCMLLGISEPLLADACVAHDAALGARISANEPLSSAPAGGDDMHSAHLCHCAHTHAGVLRHPGESAAVTMHERSTLPALPEEMRSGPTPPPLLRPPLSRPPLLA